MILIIDNYDSFVYTLSGYVQRLGATTTVIRNDKITIEDISVISPEAIIISPGPCAPKQAGICLELIRTLGAYIPMLGVCLGHQAIGEAYGGQTIHAQKPVHGKACIIEQNNSSEIFSNIPASFKGGRYHSLVTDLSGTNELRVTAISPDDGEIMAVQHKQFPVFGVQFHPESILTDHGIMIISNFLDFTCYKNSIKNNVT